MALEDYSRCVFSSTNSITTFFLQPIGDERSNKSHDDLSRVGEELDEDVSMSGSNNNIHRTLDELTQKCQRSMQLLKYVIGVLILQSLCIYRLCNPNAPTESVEQLLDLMVEERSDDDDGDDPMNRLERLNQAFGALQKCLEDTTSSSRTNSPRTAVPSTFKYVNLLPYLCYVIF